MFTITLDSNVIAIISTLIGLILGYLIYTGKLTRRTSSVNVKLSSNDKVLLDELNAESDIKYDDIDIVA